MHTTLAKLKDIQACIPGYTRMAAFFTTRPEMKDVPIPLFMVALVAGSSDCEWVADNGFVLDHKEFEGVYRANLWRMLRHNFWRTIGKSDYTGDGVARAVTRDAAAEIEVMNSHEQALAFIEKHTQQSYSGDLWSALLSQASLHSPLHFVRQLCSSFTQELHHGHRQYRMDTGLIKLTEADEKQLKALGDDSSDDDEDYSPRERMRRREREAERRTNFIARKDDGKHYFDLRSREPDNYSLARMLAGGRDPFIEAMRFVHEHNLPSFMGLKGAMISQASDKEPPAYHMSLNLTDAEMMFRVLHLIKATDFDINKMCKVQDVATEVEAAVQGGALPRVQALDSMTVNAEGSLVVSEA